MDQQKKETALEENYLRETIEEAESQLAHAQNLIEHTRFEIVEMKKELRDDTQHSFTNLAGSEDFEALIELSQQAASVNELGAEFDEAARKIRRLESLIKSPYFARIDFRFEEEPGAEKIYIGRTALTTDKALKNYVYDWRSPIAGVFYQFMTGTAFYDAPAGRITGNVEKKRQYEIRDGELIYFFDTDRNISDEILKQLLSQNTTPKMRSIVETIQAEQDIVIRNMEDDLLMIQGVAGSGKTSIALHRAAYLMYHGHRARLAANHILILSPNVAFEQYISDVLPQLGEENTVSMVFEDILQFFLKGKPLQTLQTFLEQSLAGSTRAQLLSECMSFKMSDFFREILDRFCADIPLYSFPFQDIRLGENLIAAKEELQKWILQQPQLPLAARMQQVKKRVSDRLEEIKGLGRREQNILLQELQQFMSLDLCELYKTLWREEARFADLSAESAGKIREIRRFTLDSLESGTLPFDDATAILYLHLKIYGSLAWQELRQVIIDEAQDYYPLQYRIFALLFPNAKYTILGDINQTLAKQETLSLYEQLPHLLGKKNASLITLSKSFRCTDEILQFALQFIRHKPNIQCFNRSGDAVTAVALPSRAEYLSRIVDEVKTCTEKGFDTVCLICRTEKNCIRLSADLSPLLNIRLINNGEADDLKGVILLPIYLAKGLEFDAVIVCDADSENYSGENDRKILYVACTRALHRLNLFAEGSLTPLIRAILQKQ